MFKWINKLRDSVPKPPKRGQKIHLQIIKKLAIHKGRFKGEWGWVRPHDTLTFTGQEKDHYLFTVTKNALTHHLIRSKDVVMISKAIFKCLDYKKL